MQGIARPRSLLQRLFLSFSGIIVVATLLFGALAFTYLSNVLKVEQEKDFLERGKRAQALFTQAMSQAWQQADNVLLSSFVRNVTSGFYSYNEYDLYQYQENLHLNSELNTVIDGLFLYFPGRDMVLSTVAIREDRDKFFQYDLVLDGEQTSLPNAIGGISYRGILLARADYLHQTRDSLVLLQKDVTHTPDKAAVIGFVLPLDHILPADISLLGDELQVFVSQGQRCFSYGQSVFQSDEDALASMRKSDQPGRIAKLSSDGKKIYTLFYDLGNGITFALFQNERAIITSVSNIRWIALIALIVILAACVILAYWMAKRNARPITQLLNMLPVQKGPRTDEIKALYASVTDLARREKSIRGQMEQTLPEFQRYVLERIAQDDKPWDDASFAAVGIAGLDSRYGRIYITVSACKIIEAEPTLVFQVRKRWAAASDAPLACQGGLSVHLHSWKELAPACRMADCLLSCAENPSSGDAAQPWVDSLLNAQFAGRIKTLADLRALMPAGHTGMWLREDTAAVCLGMVRIGDGQCLSTQEGAALKEAIVKNYGDAQLQQKLKALLDVMAEERKKDENRRRDEEMRNRIREEISLHYLESDYSLENLAGALNLSSTYVSALISSSFNEGFVDMVNALRVAHASKLLLQPCHTLEQVALASGFHSMATFRRAFKRVYSMPPVQYRAAHQNRENP